jgi:triosephosphate isomerase
MTDPAPLLVATSLKMYFSHARTMEWCSAVASIAAGHPAVADGQAELLVMPTFVSIPSALTALRRLARVGAQNVSEHEPGPYTGEVSAAELAELGCTAVEIGHAERRRLFGETDAVVRAKTATALRHGLEPVLCVGEQSMTTPAAAAAECIRQLDDALETANDAGTLGPVTVAYEPVWAIGASKPATTDHIRAVCEALRERVRGIDGRAGSRVIYGGSASPGLLTELAGSADGVFLGRFAHDPDAIGSVLDEARALQTA